MSLGEAFIEVHADLRPFVRDLGRQLRTTVEAFEKSLSTAVGSALGGSGGGTQGAGRQVGDKLSRGIKQSLISQLGNKNVFIVVASALAGALDDGISALPTEVKAAIVAAILAISPLLAGALAGAVSAGIGAGIAGIGVLIGFQFESVRTRAVDLGRFLRERLTLAASGFELATLSALGQIKTRFMQLELDISDIFGSADQFVEPLTEGALDAIESIIVLIADQIEKIEPFVDELGAAFATLGDAIATSMAILIATGEDGRRALRDLVALLAVMLHSVSALIFGLAKLYGVFRQVAAIVTDILGPLAGVTFLVDLFFDTIDRRTNESKSFVNTNAEMEQGFLGLIAATQGETDALKDYADKLKEASNGARENLELNVAWEESLDSIAESLKKNGKNLDIDKDKGRANVKEFINGLKLAEERAMLRVQRGEQTSEQAAAQYQREIEQLKKLATQAGISEQQFNDLFGQIVNTASLQISSSDMGLVELNATLGSGVGQASKLYSLLSLIKNLSRNIGTGALAGVRGFADGGMHYLPEIVRVAEDGPEVTIPLTKPARAAALLQQSGLSSMLGGGGPSQILVFIGNEQLDARMVRIVERGNNAQALVLSQGTRRF